LVVIGGAAALLQYGATRATKDIDAFRGIDQRVVDAAQRAYELTGLRVPIDPAAVADPPYHYEERLQRVRFRWKRLTVLVPERHDLALMKTMRAERHDLDVIAEMNERRPLDFPTLVRRFDEEMGQAIGYPAIHRLQFQSVIARLFGDKAAASVAKPGPRRRRPRLDI